MLSLPLVVFTFMIVLSAYFYFKHQKKHDSVKNIPGPPGLPLVRNIFDFPSPEFVIPKYMTYFKDFGRTFRLSTGRRGYVVTCDQKIIHHFIGRTKDLPKPYFYTFLKKWWGDSLSIATGEKWKSRRRLFHAAMHPKSLEDSISIFNKSTDLLILKLRKEVGRSLDIRDLIHLCALDIICEATMGVLMNAQLDPNNEYKRAIRKLDEIFTSNAHSFLSYFPFLYPLTEKYKEEEKALKIVNDLSRSVIKDRKSQLEKGDKSRRNNLLDQLLEAKEDGRPLTDEDVREEVNLALFAGHDSTTNFIVYALWALAKNFEVQEKLFKDLEKIMGENPSKKETLEDLQQMEYLEMVLKESNRIYPVVAYFGRAFDEDEEFGGFLFRKGETLIPFFYASYRDPEYFPEPEKFVPERFSPGYTPKQNLEAHVPFGLGPRICVGRKFAYLEAKAVVSRIIRNFVLYPEPYHELDFVVGTVMTARNGVKIRFEKRYP